MILVDPRVGERNNVPRSERLEAIIKSLRTKVRSKVKEASPMLSGGDFYFEGNGPEGPGFRVGIEWKTLSDFLGSMRSGRLSEELKSMNRICDLSFVITQGIWRVDRTGALVTLSGRDWRPVTAGTKECFRYAEMFKHWVSMCVKKNVMVLHSANEEETMWMVAHLHDWFQVDWDEHNSTDPIKVQTEVTFTKVTLVRQLAAVLPGIGWKRSREVEKEFMHEDEPVVAMVTAPIERWKSIEGIGDKTARRIWKALRTREY